MSIAFMPKDSDAWTSSPRLPDMPMQLYATECAAQVSTLACSILRRPLWSVLSVRLSCHMLFLYICKSTRGVPPLPPTLAYPKALNILVSFLCSSCSEQCSIQVI